jgi:hypothetical protein
MMDSSVAIGTDLFQVYFNMSMAVGKELIYLEKKESELMDYLAERNKAGDTQGRDKIRNKQDSRGGPVIEVKNKDTKQMSDLIADARNSLTTLQEQLKQLLKLNQRIADKQQYLTQYEGN